MLGLDLGTNSIGWALIKQDFENKQGEILDKKCHFDITSVFLSIKRLRNLAASKKAIHN